MLDFSYWIEWIISDYTPFEYDCKQYFISTPSRENRFLSERRFLSVYRQCLEEGVPGEEYINKLLKKYKLWSDEDEKTFNKLNKDIDDIKVYIYESYTSSDRKKHFRKALKDTNDYINNMSVRKYSLDNLGAKYIANTAKQNFLMGCSIFRGKNKPLFKDNSWWINYPDHIIQYCYNIMGDYILSEKDFRELARSNIWRNIWNSKKGNGSLFGRATVDLSIYQRQLVMWSNLYDNIYKNSDCPPDEIIEDDDALDGWMIKQKRSRDNSGNLNAIENKLSDKVKNSEEIYIMCDPEDISKVYECNDITGKIRWNSIMKQVQKEGTVSYMHLKDTQTELMRKINEKRGLI